jgi:transcriptional regulator with XRE-family HTH domain
MDYSLLGKRIREERLRLNLTQEKLAEDVNISTAYLGQIERGERSITLDKLIPLVNRLGVTVDFLLSDYVSPSSDVSINRLAQLLQDRTDTEKEMAVNMIKLMFSYTDGKI